MKKPKIIDLILDQVSQEVADEWRPPRHFGSFRASELGDCPRAVQLTITGHKPEPPYPELALLFRDGHLHHDAVRACLSKVGRLTNIEHQTWKAYEADPGNGRLLRFVVTATVDGIFNGSYPFDIKSINPFSFKALTKKYVREKYRHYIIQLQTYMDILDKEWGFLIFKNKMNGALKVFWYKRDKELLNATLRTMAKIMKATSGGRNIKRPYSKSSRECKGCFMRIHCWKKPMDRRAWH